MQPPAVEGRQEPGPDSIPPILQCLMKSPVKRHPLNVKSRDNWSAQQPSHRCGRGSRTCREKHGVARGRHGPARPPRNILRLEYGRRASGRNAHRPGTAPNRAVKIGDAHQVVLRTGLLCRRADRGRAEAVGTRHAGGGALPQDGRQGRGTRRLAGEARRPRRGADGATVSQMSFEKRR